MTLLDFFARWRVRIGYLLAVVVLWISRPNPHSILIGAAIGIIGLIIRACAAGYLHKQSILTTTGPYAYTRNPIYLSHLSIWSGWAVFYGSVAVAAGVAVMWLSLTFVVLPYEERGLMRQLGEPYVRYQQHVHRWFGRRGAALL